MNIKLIAFGCVLVAVGLTIVVNQNTAIAQDANNARTYGDENTNVYVHDAGEDSDRVFKLEGETTVYRDHNNVLHIEGNDSPITVMSDHDSAYEQYRLGELKTNGANVPDVVNVYSEPNIYP